MTIVIYSFQGVELVGNAAGETESPHTILPKVILGIGIRIILFYGLAIAILALVYPRERLPDGQSPLFGSFPMWAFRGGYLDDVGDLFCGGVGCEFGNLCQFANVMVDGGRPFRTSTF